MIKKYIRHRRRTDAMHCVSTLAILFCLFLAGTNGHSPLYAQTPLLNSEVVNGLADMLDSDGLGFTTVDFADGTTQTSAAVGGGITASSTDTLTNKTIDANGTGNSITNIDLTADIIGTLPIANGGTNATDAATALSNVGGIGVATTDTLTNKTIADILNTVHADVLHISVRNVSGGTLSKGLAVYVSGYNAGQDKVEVSLADADVAAEMPAVGLVEADISNNSNGVVLVSGVLNSIDTSSFSVGDVLYVSTTPGVLTATKPAINGDLIQAIAKVNRSHASLGVILIQGAGRTNDIPNNLTMINTGSYRTGTSAADAALLTAYDVDGASYTTFATLTANNTPTFDLSSSVTVGGSETIMTASTTDTPTNKTFDANGTGNSLSNVDVADLSNGTDGELITWSAAGVPATVVTGSATEVLTSNGAGTAPTFQTVAASSGDFSNGGDTAGANRTLGNDDGYVLFFETNDTARIRIEGDGRITAGDSVGAQGPDGTFHIVEAGTHAILAINPVTAGWGSWINFKNAGSNKWYLSSRGTTDAPNDRFSIHNSGAALEVMTFLQGGDVGIGVNDPDTPLEILNAGNQLKLSFDDTNNTIFAVDTSGDMTITSSGTKIGIAANLSMANDKLILRDTNAGLTASTTQTQGQGAFTAEINEVSTVANNDDTVTLPTAIAGLFVTVINNGANTLQIFPASGDNLGEGVNNAQELEANEDRVYVAYDSTNWKTAASTEIIHAEIHDEDNTDVFVINDAGADFHSYHTNGITSGDLAGWTFDIGGSGTSYPIASIADAGGGDITVTTTGTHGLAIGDIISQTNLADAAYVGIFDVLTVPTTTTYTVTAAFTADGTGTMDQASVLIANTGSAGSYTFSYWISATSATNNETFDFELYKEASLITGSKVRRKFGTAADFGSLAGGGIVTLAGGDKISLALSNEDSAGNITIRNFTLVLTRL